MYFKINFLVLILLGFILSFLNGYNNCANLVAIPISTRFFIPLKASVISSILAFIGYYFFNNNIVKTFVNGIVDINILTNFSNKSFILFSIFLTSIFFNIFFSFLGFPVSTSHLLIGSFIGSVIAAAKCFSVIKWYNLTKIFLFLILTPFIAFILSYLITKFIYIIGNYLNYKIKYLFNFLQFLSFIFYSLVFGANEGKRNLGILTFSLILLGYINQQEFNDFFIPKWLFLLFSFAIPIGVLFGGVSVIKTIGLNIYKIRNINGFASQLSTAIIIYFSTILGIPLSTTHIVSTSIMGSGTAERIKAVKWNLSKNIFFVWLFTLPISFLFSFLLYNFIFLIYKI